MIASILAIGDELLSGQIVDTNSPFLADALRAEGIEVVSTFAVADDESAIRAALDRALSDADVVLTTGGLGPTPDDVTTAAVASFAGIGLELHSPSLALIEARFRNRGLEMPPSNRKQAMLPAGSTVIPNELGSAPGFICRLTRDGRSAVIASLPGVPREMEAMARESVIPALRAGGTGQRFASRAFSIFGLSESALAERLDDLIAPDEGRLSFRAAFPRLHARVTLRGSSTAELERRLGSAEEEVRRRLGEHLYATGDVGLEEAMGELLRERGLTLAVAESCTGGLIGHRITDVPGSSGYFLGGLVAYADSAKLGLLGVSAATLEAHGAVSRETAEEMATGARAAFGSDLGLATTGIAGPGGGTSAKPVGTVCVALAWETGTWSRRYDLGARERDWVKGLTAQLALDSVRRWLIGTLPE
jgi:nicotinamide-nucleotide amidase